MKSLLATAAATLVICSPLCHAQEGEVLQKMLFTVGTTVEDSGGSHWSYLVWEGTESALADGRDYAVYRRTGTLGGSGGFVRVGVSSLQTDSRAIDGILKHARGVGQDLVDLDATLDELFGALMPAGSLSIGEKLSAVIRGAVTDPKTRENLTLLARQHPGVTMVLGHGFADKVPARNKYVYEVRVFDTATQTDSAVVGRVQVNTDDPLRLSEPGAPFDVLPPEGKDPRGHLATRLRWSTPDKLRALSIAQNGFNVYRFSITLAENLGFDSGSPSRTAFLNAVEQNPDDAKLLNRLPILTDRDLDANEATDANDRDTYFFVDDNRRFDGGTMHKHKDAFYYFVTALDFLGNDGQPSRGTKIAVHDKMPPSAPRGLNVKNDFVFSDGVGEQRLKLSWDAADPGESTSISRYWIYRWDTVEQIHQVSADPANTDDNHRIADLGSGVRSYRDDGIDAPEITDDPLTSDAGVTYWYTVRSRDAAGNPSAHSAPTQGVLRQRSGPGKPTSTIAVTRYEPSITHASTVSATEAGLDKEELHLSLRCRSASFHRAGLAFAEYRLVEDDRLLARVPFKQLTPAVYGADRDLSFDDLEITEFQVKCRVFTRWGRVSEFAVEPNMPKPVDIVAENVRRRITFTASMAKVTAPPGGDNRHEAVNDDGTVNPVTGETELPEEGVELRLFRRVNDGELKLVYIQRGSHDIPIFWSDPNPPKRAALLCYYHQAIDEEGNAGPIEQIPGACVRSEGTELYPVPMMAQPDQLGNPGNAKFSLTWVCPAVGVERFEVCILSPSASAPVSVGGELSENLAPTSFSDDSFPGYSKGVYQTPRAASFPNAERGEFSVDVNVEPGVPYVFFVRAVGEGPAFSTNTERLRGADSEPRQTVWVDRSPSGGPNVRWPARPVAPVTDFHEGITAEILPEGIQDAVLDRAPLHVGILIGRLRELDSKYRQPFSEGTDGEPVYELPSNRDPREYIFRNGGVAAQEVARGNLAGILFPCMIYRIQVDPNTGDPVTGDTVQVTPLMEEIAYEKAFNGPDDVVKIHDPFVASFHRTDLGQSAFTYTHNLYLVDRNPVVAGATYKYLITRFDPQMEIERVIPTNAVTIPSN